MKKLLTQFLILFTLISTFATNVNTLTILEKENIKHIQWTSDTLFNDESSI